MKSPIGYYVKLILSRVQNSRLKGKPSGCWRIIAARRLRPGAAKVRLVPNDDRTGKKASAFRVFAGHSRIGEAWKARTGGLSPKGYLKVKLDDPVLAEP